MNNLIIFFTKNDDDDIKLIGIGLTDKMIDHIKKSGGVLEESHRSGEAISVAILYGSTEKDIMDKIERSLGEHGSIEKRYL